MGQSRIAYTPIGICGPGAHIELSTLHPHAHPHNNETIVTACCTPGGFKRVRRSDECEPNRTFGSHSKPVQRVTSLTPSLTPFLYWRCISSVVVGQCESAHPSGGRGPCNFLSQQTSAKNT